MLLTGGITLLAVFALAAPAYHVFKQWRAQKLAALSQAELQNGEIEKAVEHARAAYLLEPDETVVLRAVTRTFTTLHDSTVVSLWKQLLEKPDATPEDRRNAVDCALSVQQLQLAAKWLEPLLSSDAQNAETLLLAAKVNLANGNREQALQFSQQAVNADPKNQAARYFDAVLRATTPETFQSGVDALFQLTANDDSWGLNALETLARATNLSRAQYEQIIARLRKHPLAKEQQMIEAWTLEIQLNPSQRNAILDQAEAAQKQAKPEQLGAFCGWLNSLGEYQRVLELLPPKLALTRKDLLLPRLDALAGLKKWADVSSTLSVRDVPLEEYFIELFLMRCADEQGDDVSSGLHWQNAQTAAASDPKQSLFLANYMERLGQPQRALELYQKISHNPTVARGAYEGVLRLTQPSGTAAVSKVLDEMAKTWPHDAAVLNDDAYFKLLLVTQVSQMYTRARLLVKEDPSSLPHRTVLALACLRMNDPAAAMQVYEGLNVNWALQSPSNVAVYAATLKANGRDERAESIARNISANALRPEERALLEIAP